MTVLLNQNARGYTRIPGTSTKAKKKEEEKLLLERSETDTTPQEMVLSLSLYNNTDNAKRQNAKRNKQGRQLQVNLYHAPLY